MATTLTASTAPTAEPGYKTTEFYVALVGMIVSFLVSSGVIGQSTAEQVTGVIGLLVSVVGYVLSRGIRKAGTQG